MCAINLMQLTVERPRRGGLASSSGWMGCRLRMLCSNSPFFAECASKCAVVFAPSTGLKKLWTVLDVDVQCMLVWFFGFFFYRCGR